MSIPTLDLGNEHVSVTIDPGRGADVLALTDRRTGVDVLFRTPWRERADAIREGQSPTTFDPVAGWLEQYRGGWQTLCPIAGDPRIVHGAPVGFHGEASAVGWTVDESSATAARLHVDLFSVPVRIDRAVSLSASTFQTVDTLTNLSGVPLEFDYSSHPAFGGAFLDGDCRIETGARRFTGDPTAPGTFEPGSEHAWPFAGSDSVDLREVPLPGSSREVFGWLDEFDGHWASVTNLDLGLGVRIEWDGEHLPFAWVWQELNATEDFPWYGRARALAIEPASTQTSGPERRSVIRLGPEESIHISISVSFEDRSSS